MSVAMVEELQRQLAIARDALTRIAEGGTMFCAFEAGGCAAKALHAMESPPEPAQFCAMEAGPW